MPLHGKVSTIRHKASGLFRGLNDSFEATRYHSLVVGPGDLPVRARVTAEADGLIMGLQHAERPVHGVQFHPESIRSQHGTEIVKNSSIWRSRGTRDVTEALPACIEPPDPPCDGPWTASDRSLPKVAGGETLERAEARAAFDWLLSGEVTPVQAAAFLVALKMRGEAVEEIVGAAERCARA